jgi:dihydropyrimidine dehydrogenase (NAD+) subunit PreT
MKRKFSLEVSERTRRDTLAMPPSFVLPVLPDGRLEQRIGESKPAYNEAEAVTEANRCLYCVDAPCIKACPTAIDIPTFIRKIATGNVKGAARTILAENLLGILVRQGLPVEVLCAGACVYNAWGASRSPSAACSASRPRDPGQRRDEGALTRGSSPRRARRSRWWARAGQHRRRGLLALEGHKAVIFERKQTSRAGSTPWASRRTS